MAKKNMEKVGAYAFLGGVALALLVGVITAFADIDAGTMGLITGIMVLLGLVVGALNITDEEVNSFIIAAIGLSVGSASLAALGSLLSASAATQVVGDIVRTAFTVFGTFVAGAVFIPALKAVYRISSD